MPALSFTGERQLRFPAPDVARGFMLALIALANVPWWLKYFPGYPTNRSELLQVMNAADQWWFIVRSLFVDRRAYPLFSILFGFGMAIMAMRTMERERRAAREAVSSEVSAGWAPVQRQIFDEEVERRARRAASRLIRRRGWWMLAFGALHGVVFAGDIIGAYGLAAVIFAEVVVSARAWLLSLIGALSTALFVLSMWGIAIAVGSGSMSLGTLPRGALHPLFLLMSLGQWIIVTPMTLLTSLVVPSIMIGVGVARLGLLQDPPGHRAILGAIAAGGLTVGAAGGIPFALGQLGWAFADSLTWANPLYHLSGLLGACGWLALLALIGGGPRESLGTVCTFLSAIGRRSMTAYLSQTLVFILVFGGLGVLGVRFVGSAMGALIALGVWVVIGIGCILAEVRGSSRGPAERALRSLVARSARPLPMPALPVAAAQDEAGASWSGASSGGADGTDPAQ